MKAVRFQPGDWVIFRKTKHSLLPGPRAEDVNPASHGDLYTYSVDKFWIVRDVMEDGSLILVTRRGKQHIIRPGTPCLRKANWWERLRFRSRFETVAEHAQSVN